MRKGNRQPVMRLISIALHPDLRHQVGKSAEKNKTTTDKPTHNPMTTHGLIFNATSSSASKYLISPAAEWNPSDFFVLFGIRCNHCATCIYHLLDGDETESAKSAQICRISYLDAERIAGLRNQLGSYISERTDTTMLMTGTYRRGLR